MEIMQFYFYSTFPQKQLTATKKKGSIIKVGVTNRAYKK